METTPRRPVIFAARRVHTMADGTTVEGADAVLVRNGRIEEVGRRDALAASTDAAVVDLGDVTLTPGLTDAHVHLVEWALSLGRAQVAGAASPDVVADRVAEAAPDAGWVLGHGWNRHLWDTDPHRSHLDRRLPDRPVVLTSADMHAVWANSVALERAGIGPDTPDPEGGRLSRDGDGVPTGVLYDNAMPLLLDVIPAPGTAEVEQATVAGQTELHRHGITGVQSVEPDTLGTLERLRSRDLLRLRVLQHLPLAKLDEAIHLGLRSGFGGDWIRIGGIKMFLDGSLGSLTARMLEPYEGSGDRGVQTLETSDFQDAVRRAARAGLASTVHAIGDEVVALALETLADPETRVAALPHRIEHVQLLPPGRAADAGRGGIVCSVQPSHLIADWAPADRHWGPERAPRAYAFRSLLDGGAVLAFGSDLPAGPMDPRLTFLAATARQGPDGVPEGGWYPDERLTPGEALRAYTVGPAHAAGRLDHGRLVPGAVADMVAWTLDPLTLRGTDFMEQTCAATIVAGDIVWSEG